VSSLSLHEVIVKTPTKAMMKKKYLPAAEILPAIIFLILIY
jgi:hypothetical protein